MPKEHQDNPYSLINRSIADATSTSGVPFKLEGLPAEAWKCLCLVAWKRLERSNPRWADLIENEVWQFRTTWLSRGYLCNMQYRGSKAIVFRHGGNVGDAWLIEALQCMLKTSLKPGQTPLNNPRWILMTYNQLLFAVKAFKKAYRTMNTKPLEAREGFWRTQLQGLLDRQPYHDESRTHATVTDEMIKLALDGPASEVALEIMRHLHDLSPSTLKQKLFPRVKKTPLSPIEWWRDKLLKSPR